MSTTPTQVLAKRVLEVRNACGWSQDEVARRLNLYGLPWSRTTVAKVENTSRQVTVDELVALAFVFGVPPAALLTPREAPTVRVTPNTTTGSGYFWRWQMGLFAMGGGIPGEVLDWTEMESLHRRYDEACPDSVAMAERRLPGLRALARLAVAAASGLSGPEDGTGAAAEIDVLPHVINALTEAAALATELAARAGRRLKEVTP